MKRKNSIFVIDKSDGSEHAYDVYSRLLKDRIIFLKEEINDDSATSIVAQLLLLDQDSDSPINLYINSGGGSVTDGLAILDTMNHIKAPVNTICMGVAASMAAVLLSAGAHRAALPNSWIMIHEPRLTPPHKTITTTEQEQETKLSLKFRQQLIEILAKNTGQSVNKIKKDSIRDFWMTSEEAKKYGIIDEILKK